MSIVEDSTKIERTTCYPTKSRLIPWCEWAVSKTILQFRFCQKLVLGLDESTPQSRDCYWATICVNFDDWIPSMIKFGIHVIISIYSVYNSRELECISSQGQLWLWPHVTRTRVSSLEKIWGEQRMWTPELERKTSSTYDSIAPVGSSSDGQSYTRGGAWCVSTACRKRKEICNVAKKECFMKLLKVLHFDYYGFFRPSSSI